MQLQITQQQEDLINNTAYTHDYTEQWEQEVHGDSDTAEYYTTQFEQETGVLARSKAYDVGGIIIYMAGPELVAFYDYENVRGTVFA